MSNFTIRTSAGDSNGPTDSGNTTINNTSNNVLRVNTQAVPHNASVVPTTAPGTTPGDITIVAESIVFSKVLAMEFVCTLSSLNANTGTPQVYLKLVDALGSSYDFVIPLVPGQIFTWIPVPTKDANGNPFTLETDAAILAAQALAANFTIVCTPDQYSDVTISGTIELSA